VRRVTEQGTLRVHRAAASGRYRRGTYGVYVDGERTGDLRDGQSIDIHLDVGDHEVQVGTMTYPYSGTPRLLGSPVLPIEIHVGRTARVVATPADPALLRQTRSPEAVLTLSTEDADQPVSSTPVPVAADGAQRPNGARNFLTAGMIDAKKPWRTWQAIVTTICAVFCFWVALVSLFVASGSAAGRGLLAVVFLLVGALFASQLLIAARARRATHQSE
jgi:hypothetical protein